jgi:DNA-binding SARP family transcriptional activator
MVNRLELRVLGPLVLSHDGRPSSVGGVKPRQLLATLALHHGHTVSVDHLVEVLWPQTPPRSALANVHTYVSALRAQLGEHRLRRQPPGYRLELAAAELDLLRFERGEASLDATLALWRGSPVEDLPPSPLWTVEIGRLTDRWWTLRQDRARARIDAGDAPAAVADLRTLVAEEPLREEAWALLVTALAAAGRRAEALAAYASARRILAEELGVDPGEPLRRLHRTLLADHGDPLTDSSDRRPESVAASGSAEARLDGDAAVVLRGLARLAGEQHPQPAWVAAALLDRPDASPVLDALERARLLRREGVGAGGQPRYGLPMLVGLLAPGLVEGTAEAVDAGLVRVLAGYLTLTEQAASDVPPQVFGPGVSVAPRWPVPDACGLTADGVGWFTAERENLVGAVEVAAREGRADLAWELAHALVAWYDLEGRTAEWEQTHRTALASCRAAGDLLGEAVMLRGLGQLHLYQDRYDDAADAFGRSRLLFARRGNASGEAAALAGLGTVHRVRAEFEEAYACYERALRSYQELGHRRGEAYAYGALGMVCLARDELARARDWFTSGLAIAEEIADPHRCALLTRYLGVVQLRRGEDVLARTTLTSALDRFAALGDAHCEAYCLADFAALEPVEAALARLTTALEIFERIGDRKGQAQTARRLGELHHDVGREGLSEAYLAEAVRLQSTVEIRVLAGKVAAIPS